MRIVFACPHGAGKSRVAAAWFGALRAPGWTAVSVASEDAQPAVGSAAVELLAGTAAEPYLDLSAPRPLAAIGAADRLVAIDGDVPGAIQWRLTATWPSPGAVEEIRQRVQSLVADLEECDDQHR